MDADGLTGFEVMVLILGAVAAILIGTVWAGSFLALTISGQAATVTLKAVAKAIGRLPPRLADPASAWPAPYSTTLPGPLLYWLCTALAAAVGAGVVALVYRLFGPSRIGTAERRPLGVDARPQFARRRDSRRYL